MISNVNSSLKEADIEARGRHNTATLAAISLASDHTPRDSGIEEEEVPVDVETSIDMILGERENVSDSSGTPDAASPTSKSPEPLVSDTTSQEETESQEEKAAEQDTVDKKPEELPLNIMSPEPEEEEIVLKPVMQDTMTEGTTRADNFLSPEPVTPDMSPGPDEAAEMDVEEAVESSRNGDTGNTTVMTTVTVACSSHGGSPDEERRKVGEAVMVNGVDEGKEKEEVEKEEGDKKGEKEEDEMSGEKRERSSSSTQILVTDHENTTFSVNLSGYDSDNTQSGEESHTQLPQLTENGVDNSPKGSPKSSPKGSPNGSPKIVIKEDRIGSRSSHNSNASSDSSIGSSEGARLAAPGNQRRRCKLMLGRLIVYQSN